MHVLSFNCLDHLRGYEISHSHSESSFNPCSFMYAFIKLNCCQVFLNSFPMYEISYSISKGEAIGVYSKVNFLSWNWNAAKEEFSLILHNVPGSTVAVGFKSQGMPICLLSAAEYFFIYFILILISTTLQYSQEVTHDHM